MRLRILKKAYRGFSANPSASTCSKALSMVISFVAFGVFLVLSLSSPKIALVATPAGTGPNHVLALPYYTVKDGWESTLVLNNAVSEPLPVSITLYSLAGEALTLPVQTLGPLQNKTIDLSEFTRRSPTFRQGSVQLSFNHENGMALGPQLTVENQNQHQSIDMEPAMGQKSNKLEGLWWSLDQETDAIVILCNTLDQPLTVLVTVDDRGRQLSYPNIRLSAHQTVLLSVDDIRRTLNLRGGGIGKGGLSLIHDGPMGALSAHGLVINRKSKFASNLHFVDPEGQHSSVVEGVGMRLANSSFPSERSTGFFTPMLWLRNTTSDLQTVNVDVQYTVTGQFKVETLTGVNLQPHDVRLVDFSTLLNSLKLKGIDDAGVRVSSTGPNGAIIGELVSISNKGGGQDVPLTAVRPNETRSGAHPFAFDEDHGSVLHLKNFGTRPTTAIVKILFEGGDYALDLVKILAGQSVAIHLETLRNSNTPDIHGHHWPEDITTGQVTWVRHGDQPVIGRLVRFSRSDGQGSTFSCGGPCGCPPIFHHSDMSPQTVNGTVGGTAGALTAQEWVYYNACPALGVEGPFTADATFESEDPGNVFVDSYGSSMSFNGAGETPITATWNTAIYNQMQQECGEGNCEPNCVPQMGEVTASAQIHVAPRVGKVQYQSAGSFIDIDDTLYVLQGTTVTFKAVPDPGTATWPSGKPTWSGTSGASGTGETVSVGFSDVSASATSFKTVVATSGNSITVNVLTFWLTGQLTPDDNFTDRSLTRFGVHEHITLGFSVSPTGLTADQLGGLQWQQTSGSGTLSNALTDGTGSYDVADSPGAAALQLKLLSGFSKDSGPVTNLDAVAPDDGSVSKQPLSGIKHVQNSWSCGFLGDIYVFPKDVSFFNLFFKELNVGASANGWLAFLANDGHCNPSCNAVRILNGNKQKGSRVNADDQIFSGAFSDANHGPYATGSVSWAIPWEYSVNFSQWHPVQTADQTATSTSTGRCSISKRGSGSFSAEVGDPTSNW